MYLQRYTLTITYRLATVVAYGLVRIKCTKRDGGRVFERRDGDVRGARRLVRASRSTLSLRCITESEFQLFLKGKRPSSKLGL